MPRVEICFAVTFCFAVALVGHRKITIRINCKDIEEQIIGLKDAKDVFVYRKYSLFLAVVLKYLSHDNNCFSFYFKLLNTEESSAYDDLIK